eukprot:30199-Pelagococcus_subviridis.AAC.5
MLKSSEGWVKNVLYATARTRSVQDDPRDDELAEEPLLHLLHAQRPASSVVLQRQRRQTRVALVHGDFHAHARALVRLRGLLPRRLVHVVPLHVRVRLFAVQLVTFQEPTKREDGNLDVQGVTKVDVRARLLEHALQRVLQREDDEREEQQRDDQPQRRRVDERVEDVASPRRVEEVPVPDESVHHREREGTADDELHELKRVRGGLVRAEQRLEVARVRLQALLELEHLHLGDDVCVFAKRV